MKTKCIVTFVFNLIALMAISQKNRQIDEVLINKILEKQLVQGANQYIDDADVEMPKDEFTNNELDVSMSIVKHILISNGYKFPDRETFNSKVKNIFGRKIDTTSKSTYLYVDFLSKCNTGLSHYPNNGVDYEGTYVVKNDNFISDFYYVPQLVDYQTKYSEAAKIEDTISLKRKSKYGNITIETWKSLEKHKDSGFNLIAVRQENIQRLIARNMYLFNDNKAYFPWLFINDKYFLHRLVKVFGYTDDKKMLKMVFDDTKPFIINVYESTSPDESSDPDDFGKLFWHKDCAGQAHLNQNTLDIIKETTTPENPENLAHLSDYIIYLSTAKANVLQFKQKAKLLAELVTFGQNICLQPKYAERIATKGNPRTKELYKDLMVTLLVGLGDGDSRYTKEYRLNNYYNIPHLKEWWEKAKYDVEHDPNNQ